MSKKMLLYCAVPAIVVSMLFAATAVSWEEPTSTPPDGNVPAPLNVSASNQSKEGWLTIGNTSAPSMQLDVQGIAPALGSLNVTGGAILNTGGAATGLIVANGYVGIGINDPISKFHVVGNSPDNPPMDARITVQNINAASKKSELCFFRPDTGAGAWCLATDFWAQNDDDFVIWGGGADGGIGQGRLYIGSTGNVGIGTRNQKQKLEVDGGVRLNTADARPACNLDARGTFWFIRGAAGVKDSVAVCAKNAAGAYAWRSIW